MQMITPEFIRTFIKSNSFSFLPTQPKLCVPIIFRMCQKMKNDIRFDEIKVCDNLIIEGHHRYLSSLIMSFEIGKVSSLYTSATKATTWDLMELVEEDWDTAAKIAYLNELDAKYNDLDLEFITRITSNR